VRDDGFATVSGSSRGYAAAGAVIRVPMNGPYASLSVAVRRAAPVAGLRAGSSGQRARRRGLETSRFRDSNADYSRTRSRAFDRAKR
jgi:hypothetical protein